MLFSKDIKNLRIYRQKMFLPTLETSDTPNKKTKSAIVLLTPNRQSSISLMKHPLLVNMKRYQSYYIERDLTYFIQSSKLNSDGDLEEEYVYDANADEILNEDTIWSSSGECKTRPGGFVRYEGFGKDIEILKHAFSPEDCHKVFEYLGITIDNPMTDACIYLVCGEFPDIDNHFSFYTHDTKKLDSPTDTFKTITIHVPRCSGEDIESYGRRITNFVIKAVYLTMHPEDLLNQKANVFADTYTDADTSFNSADPAKYSQDIFEAATPITIENLGKKFKYQSTTKFKSQKSRKLNKFSKTLEKISFAPQLNIPNVGAPNESALSEFEEGVDYFRLGNNKVLILAEDAKLDMQLKKLLWKDRIKKRQQILDMDRQIKIDCPDIIYAFPELEKYKQKNMFVDLYYYNQTFFYNNTWTLRRGFDLYLDLLDRLINDPRLVNAGYSNRTVFIPVNDWNINKSTRMWIFRESINPISIIYELLMKNPAKLAKVFGKSDVFFFDDNQYFKINFEQILVDKQINQYANKFRTFIMKINKKEQFTVDDMDTTVKNTPEAIRAEIYDKVEVAKGIDLNPRTNITAKNISNLVAATPAKKAADINSQKVIPKKTEVAKTKPEESIGVSGNKEELTKTADLEDRAKREEELQRMADIIEDITRDASDAEDALDAMDNNEELKKILINLDTSTDSGTLVSPARRSRMNNLRDAVMDKTVQGKTVRELLAEEQDKVPIPTSSLKVDSVNEQWQNMTYMNFDKTYDLNADIVACFNHFATVSIPFAIREISAEDTSTSEDRKVTYSVAIETYAGKRQTLKLDIPIPKDNRFLLRGNSKVIATQFVNMPIIKTDLDTCQIVTNYQKIFVRRFKTSTGRSNVVASRIIKALKKYDGRNLKITFGDNTRICNKYQVPMDYIDISSEIDSITIPSLDTKIYFNQDKLREDYPEINYSNGMPYAVNTKTRVVTYFAMTDYNTMFATELLQWLQRSGDNKIIDLFEASQPTNSGTYTRCSILNTKIPLIVVISYVDGLEKALKAASVNYEFKENLTREDRLDTHCDWIKFSDGYLVYRVTYSSSLLLNGLKDCPTENYSMSVMNDKATYMEFLDNFGGRLKASGLDNFADCLVDPITLEILNYYHMPTNFTDILIEANNMLADNVYVRHTDTSSRRIRRAEQVAAYTYEALTEAYIIWANQIRHGREGATILLKQSAVIDKLLQSPVSSDDSINNALGAIEETNTISFKGKSGLNSDRAYSLDKRIFDDSMLNSVASSTNFSGNTGVTRISTVNMNVEGARGFVKQIDSDTSKMNTVDTLSATENMIPFESTHDDNTRIHMSYIQTAKHQTRVAKADPLLVTTGMDEAIPYLTTNKFAYKAEKDGKITKVTDTYIVIEYNDNTKDYIRLDETIEKNSDGGYYVPMKLSIADGMKEGKKVKAGEIIAYDKDSFANSLGESDNLAYKAGTLAKVAILHFDDGYEDSGVCTDKLAKAMTTQVIYKFEHVIEKDSQIFMIAKKGQYVNVDDPLVIWQDPYEDYDISSIFRTIGKDTDVSELGRRTINSDTTGTIVDIKVFRTCELKDMSPSVRKFVEEYEKPIKQLKAELEAQGVDTKSLPATYTLPPTGKLKKAQDAIYVEFYVQHDDIPGVGDKGTFFAANKFTIKKVIPKGKEPYTDFRPKEEVSALLGVTSIDKRMVTSIILNGSLNKLMVELDRSVKDLLEIPYDESDL